MTLSTKPALPEARGGTAIARQLHYRLECLCGCRQRNTEESAKSAGVPGGAHVPRLGSCGLSLLLQAGLALLSCAVGHGLRLSPPTSSSVEGSGQEGQVWVAFKPSLTGKGGKRVGACSGQNGRAAKLSGEPGGGDPRPERGVCPRQWAVTESAEPHGRDLLGLPGGNELMWVRQGKHLLWPRSPPSAGTERRPSS